MNIQEQIAMNSARTNPFDPGQGNSLRRVVDSINDSRWSSWEKWQLVYKTNEGKKSLFILTMIQNINCLTILNLSKIYKRGAMMMQVKCIESFTHQITLGKVYLVIEISIRLSTKTTYFRVIDNEGYPAIYESNKFLVLTNEYMNAALQFKNDVITISHKNIANSSLNKKNVDGFWGCFIEDDIESIKILENVIAEIAELENVDIPELIL